MCLHLYRILSRFVGILLFMLELSGWVSVGSFVSRLEPRVPHVCVLPSLLRSMPVVQAPQAYPHLEKIKAGTVRTISGFVPDDDGGSVLAVLKNFSRLTNLNKSGLGLNADMMFAGSSRPKKCGKLFGNLAKGGIIHLFARRRLATLISMPCTWESGRTLETGMIGES